MRHLHVKTDDFLALREQISQRIRSGEIAEWEVKTNEGKDYYTYRGVGYEGTYESGYFWPNDSKEGESEHSFSLLDGGERKLTQYMAIEYYTQFILMLHLHLPGLFEKAWATLEVIGEKQNKEG
jgi:hypothetical protein